ncbi:MAG: CBS domain-containing protein [Gammaproteobacteria bacterium]|nr:CBS domain-containing protein [Gammaproteobacteria bacterium]
MSVGEICNREVITAERHTPIVEAAQIMRKFHTGSLVVVDNDSSPASPVGIITDRDLVIEVIAKQADLDSLAVGDIMCTELMTSRENDGIWETILRMRAMGVRRMPVVGSDGGLVGILSMDDLLEFLSGELSDLAKLIKREASREKETRPAG